MCTAYPQLGVCALCSECPARQRSAATHLNTSYWLNLPLNSSTSRVTRSLRAATYASHSSLCALTVWESCTKRVHEGGRVGGAGQRRQADTLYTCTHCLCALGDTQTFQCQWRPCVAHKPSAVRGWVLCMGVCTSPRAAAHALLTPPPPVPSAPAYQKGPTLPHSSVCPRTRE